MTENYLGFSSLVVYEREYRMTGVKWKLTEYYNAQGLVGYLLERTPLAAERHVSLTESLYIGKAEDIATFRAEVFDEEGEWVIDDPEPVFDQYRQFSHKNIDLTDLFVS